MFCKAKNEDNVTNICINGNGMLSAVVKEKWKWKDKISQNIIEVKKEKIKKEFSFLFLGIVVYSNTLPMTKYSNINMWIQCITL